jgi:hypothetical protein
MVAMVAMKKFATKCDHTRPPAAPVATVAILLIGLRLATVATRPGGRAAVPTRFRSQSLPAAQSIRHRFATG